jgi:hypothetical protein
MNIDSSPAQSSPSPSTTAMNILMGEKNMKLRGGERSKYTALKDRTFTLMSVYDISSPHERVSCRKKCF